jgi:hypothetical protein
MGTGIHDFLFHKSGNILMQLLAVLDLRNFEAEGLRIADIGFGLEQGHGHGGGDCPGDHDDGGVSSATYPFEWKRKSLLGLRLFSWRATLGRVGVPDTMPTSTRANYFESSGCITSGVRSGFS